MKLPVEYTIREAVNKDIPEIKKLVFGILDEYGLLPDAESTDKDLDDIEKYYFNNNGWFAAVLSDVGEIKATTGLFGIDEYTCELRKMYLDKAHRGKGIGRYLLEYSLEKAGELGYNSVVLETASVLKEAISLYEKYGFREQSEGHLSGRCDKRYYLEL